MSSLSPMPIFFLQLINRHFDTGLKCLKILYKKKKQKCLLKDQSLSLSSN